MPSATTRAPGQLTADPSGKFLYVCNSDNNTSGLMEVIAYSINSDGTLNLIGVFGAGPGSSVQPNGIAVMPGGNFLYAASITNRAIAGYAIGSTPPNTQHPRRSAHLCDQLALPYTWITDKFALGGGGAGVAAI